MSFAHPLALWLLAATPLPVLLHLLGHARPRELVFPGTFLLRQMQAQRRALRLRHLLLLALRMLAIAAAALAFAGLLAPIRLPLLSESRPPLVLLDASAGMGAGDAWRQAHEVAASFLAANPKATVLSAPSAATAGVPDSPSSQQGALADAASDAFDAGDLGPDQVLAVVTDLEAATVLPRRWPPVMPPVRKYVVACAAPPPGVYSATLLPAEPPATAPVRLSCAMAPSREDRVLHVLDAGRPLAAARVPASGTSADIALGRFGPGDRALTIAAPPALPYHLDLRVGAPARVTVLAFDDASRYLRAAVDPTGTGRPFTLSAAPKPDALVLQGSPTLAADQPSALIFARPGPGDSKPLPPERAESLLFSADVPPPLEAFARDFRPVLDRARVFRPLRLTQPDASWQVVARFSDGSPALLWSESAGCQVVLVGFAPLPDSTDLVSSGAFAATVQALLLTILTPHGASSPDLNPPPSCLAGSTISADALLAVWGRDTEVVPYRPGLTLPAAPPVTDLTPLLALLLVAILAAEGLLSASLSAPSPQP